MEVARRDAELMALRKEREDLAAKAADATKRAAELDVAAAESAKRIADLDAELASTIKKVSDLDGGFANRLPVTISFFKRRWFQRIPFVCLVFLVCFLAISGSEKARRRFSGT